MARTAEERRAANAECARQCRKRNLEELQSLERQVAGLKQRQAEIESENATLRRTMQRFIWHNKQLREQLSLRSAQPAPIEPKDQDLGISLDLIRVESATLPGSSYRESPPEGTSVAMMFGNNAPSMHLESLEGELIVSKPAEPADAATAKMLPCWLASSQKAASSISSGSAAITDESMLLPSNWCQHDESVPVLPPLEPGDPSQFLRLHV